MKPATSVQPVTLSSYTVQNFVNGTILSTVTPIDAHPHNLSKLFAQLNTYTAPPGADLNLLHALESGGAYYINFGVEHIKVHNAAEAYLVLAEVIEPQLIGVAPMEAF